MEFFRKYVLPIFGFIGFPTVVTWLKNMRPFFEISGYWDDVLVWVISAIVFVLMYLCALKIANRGTNNKSKDAVLPRKITFEYTFNQDSCYLDPKQSCDESFTHAVTWIHDKDDDENLRVLCHSVSIIFSEPRVVDKVELTSLNNGDILKIVDATATSCINGEKESGVNVLCNENVGIERLRLTVYLED